jgi:feruloyl-CoA synthase
MTERLDHWAAHVPNRTFLAQRTAAGGWRKLSYAEARTLRRGIGQALVDRGLSAGRPVAILSSNDIEHALLGLGCMYAGIPYSPVSPAYSLVSSDFAKLRIIFELLTPGLVFAASGARYSWAIQAVLPTGVDVELIFTADPLPGASLFSDLARTNNRHAEGSHQHASHVVQQPGDGSRYFAFVVDEPPLIVDWLPWNHTFGGNANVGFVLYNGGNARLV